MFKDILNKWNERQSISKDCYYDMMANMSNYQDFEILHKNWYLCFSYILKSFKCGFTDEAIKSLFYNFDMSNWKDLWVKNSEYKDYSKEELIDSFGSECFYISDRTSYDRLFRTHWLFRRAFEDEIDKIKYPDLFD